MVKIMVARTKQEGAGCQANDERQTLGHCGSCWSCCGAAESLSDCFCIHFGWNISVAANDIVGNTLLVLLRKYIFSIYFSYSVSKMRGSSMLKLLICRFKTSRFF
ncbi:uncharacterized protein [Solanum lycopersicum]|uniref:uncharacterized protein isoform X1 n=1 Tax=Solanum lycopersicum TaxID=4081 RepID=UPI003749CD58